MTAIHAKMGVPFQIAAWQPWNDTGIILKKGQSYKITSKIPEGGVYKDSTIKCTPDGPTGCIGWLFDLAGRDATGNGWVSRRIARYAEQKLGEGKIHRLRILRDREKTRASFLTLIAAIGHNDSEGNVHVVGGCRTIIPRASGELVLFSNDWPGGPGLEGESRFIGSRTYANNQGTLEIKLSECVTTNKSTQL